MEFKRLEEVDSTKEVIKDVFDVNLDISGSWGYDKESAVIIHSLDMDQTQFINMFATIRANIEMNLVMEEADRFAGINVTPLEVITTNFDNKKYDVATFKITAMNEKAYNNFIQEYKDNYGKQEFDLAGHFERRKEATLERVADFWFHWEG